MNFLAPWGLLLAATAAVPLLLHLLRRRTGARVEFPALRYLLRAQKEHAHEVRLRNLLLMAVRVGILLALTLALARPLGWLPLAGHAPTALVLLVDNSLSSTAAGRNGPTLARLVAGAKALTAAARSGDRIWLVTMDAEVTTGTAGEISAALDALRALEGAGDARSAWNRAAALLATSSLAERRLVLFTDAQATTWSGAAFAPAGDPPVEARVTLFVPAGSPVADRAITALTVEPRIWSPRGAVRAAVRSDDPVAWRLSLEGRTLARGTLAIGEPLHARVQPTERGWRAGSIELEPDELRGDDVRHFAVHIGPPAAVRVHADAGSFVAEAVAALTQGGRLRAGSDVHVASAEGVRPGQRALLFAPRDPLRLADANRALARAGIPWAFGARHTGSAPLRGPEVEGAVATAWYSLESRQGPDGAGGAAAGLARPSDDGADTLVRVGAAPWAVAGEGYVLVASAADPAATDLPLRASFLPWIDRVIAEHLTAAGGVVTERAPGVSAGRVPPGVDALESPDGSLHAMQPGAPFRAPWRVGVHFWRRGPARAGALVVNPEPEESDLRALAPDSLAAALRTTSRVAGDAPVAQAARPAALPRAVLAAGGRRTLEAAALVLALLLIGAELVLARRVVASSHDVAQL